MNFTSRSATEGVAGAPAAVVDDEEIELKIASVPTASSKPHALVVGENRRDLEQTVRPTTLIPAGKATLLWISANAAHQEPVPAHLLPTAEAFAVFPAEDGAKS